MYTVDTGKGWNHEFRYPCPIESHNHELFQCEAFFSMTPRERQETLKGQTCKTCFKPGGTCITRGSRMCGTR